MYYQVNSQIDLVRNCYGFYEFRRYNRHSYLIAVSDSYNSYKAAMVAYKANQIQWDYVI